MVLVLSLLLLTWDYDNIIITIIRGIAQESYVSCASLQFKIY